MKRSDCKDPFLRGYLDAALFTTDEDAPGGCDYVECGRADEMFPLIPQDFIDQAIKDCKRFEEENAELLSKAGDFWQNGADFWYTRNGHGVGFWSRDYPEDISHPLHIASDKFGEAYLELDAPYCEQCGEAKQEIALEHAGLCGDCATKTFREALHEVLPFQPCCQVLFEEGKPTAICIVPYGTEHTHP